MMSGTPTIIPSAIDKETHKSQEQIYAKKQCIFCSTENYDVKKHANRFGETIQRMFTRNGTAWELTWNSQNLKIVQRIEYMHL